MVEHGPYLRISYAPTLAFVFPKGKNKLANALYRALKDGNSLFKGLETTFRLPIDNSHVVPIPVDLGQANNEEAKGQAYASACAEFIRSSSSRPDIFLVIHDRTPEWQEKTPYHYCKQELLRLGCVSQSVTTDLLEGDPQLKWSIANIGLGLFCKLGGIPWVTKRGTNDRHLIVGIGSTDSFDPETRKRSRRTAFTTCVTAAGEFQFSTIGRLATDRDMHLKHLSETVQSAMLRAQSIKAEDIEGITVHLTKDFSTEEYEAVRQGVERASQFDRPEIFVVKVTQEERFFVVDTENTSHVPSKGTCVTLNERDHLLYTDGFQDSKSYRGRIPTAIRVREFPSVENGLLSPESLQRVLDLSQVNYRGFNAVSRPAPLVYSERIARLLSSGVSLEGDRYEKLLNAMWFL